ncbi:MAG: hypothetical protein IJC76_07135 [Lachnospiraceae bacterium]|nr:hypothetical protein [Lachnospiraceae bacterium]
MKEGYIYIGAFLLILVIFSIRVHFAKKEETEKLRKRIKRAFGNVPDREYKINEFETIPMYFEKTKGDEFFVDDITWNDLNMDNIYMIMNHSETSIGDEYLYKMLRTPNMNSTLLDENERYVKYFEDNNDKACNIQEKFARIGRTNNISIYDFIHRLQDVERGSNIIHYMMDTIFIASVILFCINQPIGILAIMITMGINIISYFSYKAKFESYLMCVKYLINVIDIGEMLDSSVKDEELRGIADRIGTLSKELRSVKQGIILLTSSNMSDSLADIVMDYVRMVLHVDIIKFNLLLKIVVDKIDTIDDLFENIGRLEACISIASFRKMLPYYCKPEFADDKKSEMSFEEIYHPSIEDAVVNDLKEKQSVLITGSNASGKSTFLKTVAINAILAQTINTCTASAYVANYYEIYSSMALRDDLESNESYYIVEIKSLKRILDSISGDKHILCFVDEVLRGTNTVERIAASSRILKSLAENNVMCFAATHDIELTHILEDYYSNYHFEEELEDNNIIFNYKLYKGRATSRNAIKLLGIIGYNEKIIGDAEKAAADFLNNGNWMKCY